MKIISPIVRSRKGEYYQALYDYFSLGYSEAIIDGKRRKLSESIDIDPKKKHDIDLVIDKLEITDQARLFEAVENSLGYSNGLVKIKYPGSEDIKLLSSNWTCPHDNYAFPELEPRLFSFNSPQGACLDCHGLGKIGFRSDTQCPTCEGKRLNKEAISVKIGDKNIQEISAMTIEDLL